MSRSILRVVSPFVLSSIALLATVQSQQIPPRRIIANIGNVTGSVDHFFDLSVGSDYPGTLIRDDSQANSNSLRMSSGFAMCDSTQSFMTC